MSAKIFAAHEIDQAAEVLRRGGLVAFPTDTVYGVAAMADDALDNTKLRAFKGGRTERFSLHAGTVDDAIAFAGQLRRAERRAIQVHCPLGVTLVVAHETVGTLGVRVVGDATGAALLSSTGAAVVATSANAHGQPVLNDPARIAELPGLDAVLDGGVIEPRPASTVAALLPCGLRLLRRGKHLPAPLRVSFVCLGNLNRSAFAHRWIEAMQAWLAGQFDDFAPLYQPSSTGLIANPASRSPADMVEAGRAFGVNLATHEPTRFAVPALHAADMSVAMGDDVADTVVQHGKGEVLEWRVPDPMGLAPDVYAACASSVVEHALVDLLPRWAHVSEADRRLESLFNKLFLMPGESQ